MSVIPTNAGISLDKKVDPKQINENIKESALNDSRRFVPKDYKDVAAGLEQQFAEMMLSEMSKTAEESEESGDGAGMEYYKGLQNTERAKTMTEQNTLGLQDMILNQIYPQRLRNEMALRAYDQMKAKKFHHNLPTLNKPEKSDTISIKGNESPASTVSDPARTNGGLE